MDELPVDLLLDEAQPAVIPEAPGVADLGVVAPEAHALQELCRKAAGGGVLAHLGDRPEALDGAVAAALDRLDGSDALLGEHGAYDAETAELDAATTTVYEMLVGLSDDAAAATGLPAGPGSHMALADTIVKDTRIPPRGFDNAAFEAGGAPAVGMAYADGQYWHEQGFLPPPGTVLVEATR